MIIAPFSPNVKSAGIERRDFLSSAREARRAFARRVSDRRHTCTIGKLPLPSRFPCHLPRRGGFGTACAIEKDVTNRASVPRSLPHRGNFGTACAIEKDVTNRASVPRSLPRSLPHRGRWHGNRDGRGERLVTLSLSAARLYAYEYENDESRCVSLGLCQLADFVCNLKRAGRTPGALLH